jgi:hypothetical protein
MRLEREKQTLSLVGMTKFWRNCMRVGRLEAVFSQRVIHHRRHEKPTRGETQAEHLCWRSASEGAPYTGKRGK